MKWWCCAILQSITLVMTSAEDQAATCFAPRNEPTKPVVSSPFVEGLNANSTLDLNKIYFYPWYALRYVPRVSFRIDRVEFIHGTGPEGTYLGTVRIQIRSDDNGLPSIQVLTEGSYAQGYDVGFQGADMFAAQLTAGSTYWVVFEPVYRSQASIAGHDDGSLVPWCYSNDGMTWTSVPISALEVWIAKFYGALTSVSVEGQTWGAVKEMYRSLSSAPGPQSH